MSQTFVEASACLRHARGYWEVFPVADHVAQKTAYRQMMKLVHPDRVESSLRTEANELVRLLGAFYTEAQAAAKTSSYGRKVTKTTMSSRRMKHVLGPEFSVSGDVTKLFRAMSDATADSLVKVARQPVDNDLLAAEASTLKLLQSQSGDEFRRFYPELLDTFLVPDGRKRLRVNVLSYMDGFYNLEQVRKFRPGGLEPLDAAWVWRRMLWALGRVHELGVVHGALTPAHVIIHPAQHGVLLADWCYSLQTSDNTFSHLKAVVPSRRSWYPASVFAKQPTSKAADLSMAARTMIYLLGGDALSMSMPNQVPSLMQRYFMELVTGKNSGSAFEQLERFDTVLQTLGVPYFPRRFKELVL